MNTGKILTGVAVAAAVGVVIGIAMAPAKGANTRKTLFRSAVKYADGVKEKLDEYIAAIAEEFDTVKDEAVELIDKGKKKAVSLAGK